MLPPDRVGLLWARLGAGQTLQEVGDAHGVSRERVRQVVGKQSKALMKDARLRLVLEGVLSGLGRGGAVLVDVREARSERRPEATPTQLWTFVMELWKLVRGRCAACWASTHTPGIFVFTPERLLDERLVRERLGERASFLEAADLADLLGVTAPQLTALACACPRLVRTRSGLYGLAGWTLPALIKATAEHLARHGAVDWHFSEMGKAIAFFDAGHQDLEPRNVVAVLSRAEVTHFEYAGRRGYWRLRALGDGHDSNRAAIRALLEEAPSPLHWSDIQARLDRRVQEGTVLALLSREPEFQTFGRGVFGLRERTYPPSPTEEAFMEGQFRAYAVPALLAEEVLERAQAAGLDPARLTAVGRYSSVYVYWQWGTHEAVFLTPREARLRQFQRWFARRGERDPPELDVFRGGLRAAFDRTDAQTILTTARHLAKRGSALSSEFTPYVQWAIKANAEEQNRGWSDGAQ